MSPTDKNQRNRATARSERARLRCISKPALTLRTERVSRAVAQNALDRVDEIEQNTCTGQKSLAGHPRRLAELY